MAQSIVTQSDTKLQAEDPRENSKGPTEIAQIRRPKLPEIKLSEFDRDCTKWLFFKDSFEITIHKDDS